MKKILFLALFAALGWVACSDDESTPVIDATTIELSAENLNLTVGNTATLTATITPEEMAQAEIVWSSSAPEVATIEGGVVTAVAVGEATITATVGEASDRCLVKVDAVAVEQIELDTTEAELHIGESLQLTATVLPENAGDKTITWESTNEAVASVDQNGLVEALSLGEATIKAKAGNVEATCAITISAVEVEEVLLDHEQASLSVGATLQLTATVLPENSTDKAVTWDSTDKAVATVDGNGLVTAVAPGQSVITAMAGGMFAVCNITVVTPAQIGDYYYSDGSYSSSLDTSKSVIGVVFWTGDPTATDPTLKRDHPNCTHGLVMALTEVKNVFWQKGCRAYNSTVSAWVEANNLEFQPLVSGIELSDPMNQVNGYNNTKAMEAFNAAPENAEWKLDVLTTLEQHRTSVAAPATSSGWYLPSIKELNLAFSGEYNGPITDFDNESTEIYDIINPKFRAVPGAIIYDDDYLSSTEKDALNIYDMMVFSWYVPTEGIGKGAGVTFRAVLAF
uniref:Ig-like domain-containing protein n=1 Tax=Alistipes sp. TaxID=1872444 RepID=UPI004056B8C1